MIYQTQKGAKVLYTTKEIAKSMGVATSTVKRWQTVYNVPRQLGQSRHARYSKESFETFKMIQSLLKAGKNKQQIKELITGSLEPEQEPPAQAQAQVQPEIDTEKLSRVLVGAIKEQNELSEKYAKASYMIGQLEAENKHLQMRLGEKEQQLKQIETAHQGHNEKISQADQEAKELKAQLNQAQESLAQSRAESARQIDEMAKALEEAQTQAARPWYKRLNKK